MRAAVLDEFGGDVTMRDVREPEPKAGEVVVTVEACGVGLTLELVAQRRVEPVIGARYGLEDTPEAYRAMEANEVFGRIVVEQK
jgi:D-arabinose 1-dehydrogenase-like Zn-dependent alcohol dehydrogenase